MSRELLTNWTEYQQGIDTVLQSAERCLCIYDPDLQLLKLESEARSAQLARLLQEGREECVRIAVRDAGPLRTHSPRLMEMLRTYNHRMSIVETPANLSHLRDCLFLADNDHGLVRFDFEQPRSKLLLNDPEEVMPYRKRFDDLWNEGNHPIAPSTLGL